LTEELQIRTWLAEDPISCVARGAGVALEEMEKWKYLFVGLERKSAQRD
jgi:rod shape-determining protein MreB